MHALTAHHHGVDMTVGEMTSGSHTNCKPLPPLSPSLLRLANSNTYSLSHTHLISYTQIHTYAHIRTSTHTHTHSLSLSLFLSLEHMVAAHACAAVCWCQCCAFSCFFLAFSWSGSLPRALGSGFGQSASRCCGLLLVSSNGCTFLHLFFFFFFFFFSFSALQTLSRLSHFSSICCPSSVPRSFLMLFVAFPFTFPCAPHQAI